MGNLFFCNKKNFHLRIFAVLVNTRLSTVLQVLDILMFDYYYDRHKEIVTFVRFGVL